MKSRQQQKAMFANMRAYLGNPSRSAERNGFAELALGKQTCLKGVIKIKEPEDIIKTKHKNEFSFQEAAYLTSLGSGAFAMPTGSQMVFDSYAKRLLDMNPMDNNPNDN